MNHSNKLKHTHTMGGQHWLHTGFLAPIKRVISNMALSSHQIFILKQTSLLCLESRYNVPVWKGMWEVMEYYLWSKSNGKKKMCNCLMWNCNTWRITDNLLLFFHLGACTGGMSCGTERAVKPRVKSIVFLQSTSHPRQVEANKYNHITVYKL